MNKLPNAMMYLNRRIKITVCADGFLSVRFDRLKARQGAALPVFSVDDLELAFLLIQLSGELKVCENKNGVTVEYRAKNWVEDNVDGLDAVTAEIKKNYDFVMKAKNEGTDLTKKVTDV